MHSSKLRGLCLMECSNEMIRYLPYFWNKKTNIDFFSFFATLFSPIMNVMIVYEKRTSNYICVIPD